LPQVVHRGPGELRVRGQEPSELGAPVLARLGLLAGEEVVGHGGESRRCSVGPYAAAATWRVVAVTRLPCVGGELKDVLVAATARVRPRGVCLAKKCAQAPEILSRL